MYTRQFATEEKALAYVHQRMSEGFYCCKPVKVLAPNGRSYVWAVSISL